IAAFALVRRAGRRAPASAATKAYLVLRRILTRRTGTLAPSVPPLEVARLFGETVPEAREDAAAVVSLYCSASFGGRSLSPEAGRDLADRVKRLKKLA
ncbi:MAG TPA: DUF4129 domain-containing protein, partial [Thermoanaerobaculia bacterium]|nr:DUF4129 domain-containing protein [Thermoanaerobaculia bacterium]